MMIINTIIACNNPHLYIENIENFGFIATYTSMAESRKRYATLLVQNRMLSMNDEGKSDLTVWIQ